MLRDRMSASLKRFIKRNRDGTIDLIDTVTGKTFDPDTQSVSGGDETPVTVDCTAPSPLKEMMEPGSSAALGDLEVYVSADDANLTFSPKKGMEADYNSERYSIVEVEDLEANNSIFGHRIFLRSIQ